jgi:hypothetical protein
LVVVAGFWGDGFSGDNWGSGYTVVVKYVVCVGYMSCALSAL